jgi:polyprenyl synthetase
MSEAWWRSAGQVPERRPAVDTLRDEQWQFYEDSVIPVVFDLLDHELSDAVGSQLNQRLRYSPRFRPSQLLYAFGQDFDIPQPSVVWASACLELLYLGRVVLDDVADQHDQRWGLPSLRVVFSDASAVQIAGVLQHIAVICATQVDSLSGGRSAVPAAGLVAEYGRRINAAMLEELEWSRPTIPESAYKAIALRKASSGQLTVGLLGVMAEGEIGDQLIRYAAAIEKLDYAASITNDVTESNLRRGLEEVRFAGGERRGKRSEIQLNRPTIFSVILGSDDFLLRNPEIGENLPDFSVMKLRQIFTYLDQTGAIRDAQHKIAGLEEEAMRLIPPGSKVYTLLDKARSPNITHTPPQVES